MQSASAASVCASGGSGVVLLAGSSWLGGEGVDVCSNSPSSTDNFGSHSTNGVYDGEMWQCVELPVRLYLTRGWITSTWWGNGDTMASPKNVPPGLTEQNNGSITYLSPGDVVSLGNATTGTNHDDGGHAAVVNSVSGSTVQLINQNAEVVTSQATFVNSTLTIMNWPGWYVIGVVHAPGGGPQPTKAADPSPAVAVNASSGLATAVADGPGHSLYTYWQDATGTWNGPLGIDGGQGDIAYSTPAIDFNPNTNLATAVAEGPGHSLYAYWQDATGTWNGPIGIDNGQGGIAFSEPAMSFDPNTDATTVVAQGPDNSLYAYFQDPSGAWNGPIGIDAGRAGIAFSDPAISFNANTSSTDVVAVGPDNSLYAYWQDATGAWNGPIGIDGGRGGIAYSTPAMASNPSTAEPTVVAQGPDNSLYAYWQDASGNWNGPLGIDGGRGGIAYSTPVIAFDPSSAEPTVVAQGPDNSLYSYWQDATGTWDGPLGVDGGSGSITYSAPAIAFNPNSATPTVVAEGPDDSLYDYWQVPSGTWYGPLGIDGGRGGIAY